MQTKQKNFLAKLCIKLKEEKEKEDNLQ